MLGQPNEGESCSPLLLHLAYRAERKNLLPICSFSQRLFCSLPRVAVTCTSLFTSHNHSAANGHPSLLAQPTSLAGSVQSVFPSSEIKQLRIKQLLKGKGQFPGAAPKKPKEKQPGSSVHWGRLHASPLLSNSKRCLTTASWDQSMNRPGKSPVKMGVGFKYFFSVRKLTSLCSVSCSLPDRVLFLLLPAIPFLTLHSPS